MVSIYKSFLNRHSPNMGPIKSRFDISFLCAAALSPPCARMGPANWWPGVHRWAGASERRCIHNGYSPNAYSHTDYRPRAPRRAVPRRAEPHRCRYSTPVYYDPGRKLMRRNSEAPRVVGERHRENGRPATGELNPPQGNVARRRAFPIMGFSIGYIGFPQPISLIIGPA